MKMVMDERMKHRVVGLAVILSIGAIFAPAIMKKSSQRFDTDMNMSVKLPPKPVFPKVAIPEKQKMFEQVKMAQVSLPAIDAKLESVKPVAKAEPLSQTKEVRAAVTLASVKSVIAIKGTRTGMASAAAAKSVKPVVRTALKTTSKASPAAGKITYGVQLATFSAESNAISLVNLLKNKGYKAKFSIANVHDNKVYRVIVGQVNEKKQAQILQQKLASVMQIKGLVVTYGVS